MIYDHTQPAWGRPCPACGAPKGRPCLDRRSYDRTLYGARTHRERPRGTP